MATARKCGICGERFTPRQKTTRFCSKPCRAEAERRRRTGPTQEPKPCRICGEEFTPKRRSGVFCSPACASEGNNRGNRSRRPAGDLASGEVSEEEKLRERVRELEQRDRSSRKDDVRDARVLDALAEAVEVRKPSFSPRAVPKSHRASEKHEFVLLWSDLHAGEVVSREETNGLNEYDWAVMMRRHDKLREALFSYQDNRPYPIEKLHVHALGDMLSGDIHDELVETNEIPLAEATVQFGLDGAEWLDTLRERFRRIAFAGVVGNHPRSKRKPQAKHAFDNADWLSYHVMRLRLRGCKGLTFEIPKANVWPVMVAQNWRTLLWHGDGVRSTMPGVPWGGVMRRGAALQNQYSSAGTPIDVFEVGHFHSANLVEGSAGRIAMNGSVKGIDEYSLKAFGGGSGPKQMLLTFHPRRGLTDMSVLDLEPQVPRPGG